MAKTATQPAWIDTAGKSKWLIEEHVSDHPAAFTILRLWHVSFASLICSLDARLRAGL